MSAHEFAETVCNFRNEGEDDEDSKYLPLDGSDGIAEAAIGGEAILSSVELRKMAEPEMKK